MSKVSIVIPVYNSAKYLNECLDSIINQTYKNIEIICVNDGSKDNSLDILKEYAEHDNRINIYTKENEGKGAASARNLGLDKASGDYVLFLDSDDFFEKDMVEVLVNKADSQDLDVVVFKADKYDDRLKRVVSDYEKIEFFYAPDKEVFNYKDCPDYIFQIGDLIAWNKLYKKTLLDEYDLKFEPIPISDDQYVPALAMIFAERIGIVDKQLLHYRFNTGTSQCDNQPKHPEAGFQATYSIVARMKDEGIYKIVKKSYLNMAIRLMREYFDKMQSYETISFLYNKYLDEVFPMLEVVDLPDDYFYDDRIHQWYELLHKNSLEEILFKTSRAYGSNMTTAILRFQLPYDKITKGSRIILVGKGMVGRYWYAQLLLSGYAEVVAFVNSLEEVGDDLVYDEVLYC